MASEPYQTEAAGACGGAAGDTERPGGRAPGVLHQVLFDSLRHVLLPLRLAAATYLHQADHMGSAYQRRCLRTAAPETLCDGSRVVPAAILPERLAMEGVLTYLLAHVTVEALHQTYGRRWQVRELYGVVPELHAYAWFVPPRQLAQRVEDVLRASVLAPVPVQLVGELYEGALAPDERKAFGQYYTPVRVVQHLFDQAGYQSSTDAVLRPTLDVATGCGVFLAEAARRQTRALRARGDPVDRFCATLGRHLAGYDLHPFAIIATKLYVLASVLDELGPTPADAAQASQVLAHLRLPHVRCADTLVESCRPAAPSEQPFWVVGNPPYGHCGEGPHLQPFRPVLHGRANWYQLFLATALDRCAPGGRIAFLMPESLRAGEYFEPLRRRLAAETTLVATTDFHARTSIFPGVEQGVVMLVCQKHLSHIPQAEPRPPRAALTPPMHRREVPEPMVSVVQAATEDDLPTARPCAVPARLVQLGTAQHHLLLKAGSAEAYALLGKLWTQGETRPRLLLAVHTGRLVWNRQRPLLGSKIDCDGRADAAGGGDGQPAWPVLYASSIRRYAFAFPPTHNNRRRAQFLYGRPGSALGAYTTTGRTLLIQRTTSRDQLHRLIATLLPPTFVAAHPVYLVENHVNYVAGAEVAGTLVPLGCVLGLLNSRLVNFLFGALSGTTQVSTVELRLLPLVYPDPREAARLADLVDQRLAAPDGIADALEREIDQLVYSWYDLTERERHHIDAYHTIRHTRAGIPVVEREQVTGGKTTSRLAGIENCQREQAVTMRVTAEA